MESSSGDAKKHEVVLLRDQRARPSVFTDEFKGG